MYTAQISFIKHPNPPTEEDDFLDENGRSWWGDTDDLLGILSYFEKNGQIIGSEYPMIEQDNKIIAFVSIAEESSLDKKYHNKYVKKELDKLGDRLAIHILGKHPDSSDVCQCKDNQQRQFLLLYTDYLSLLSPIDCGNCELPVPLYKLPKIDDCPDEYFNILHWQKDYQSYDSLQMSCITEDFCLQQLGDINSEITTIGLELCQNMAKSCGIPVYYYLYKYYGESLEREQQRKCPSCNGDWKLETPYRNFDFKCDNCHLLSNIAFDLAE